MTEKSTMKMIARNALLLGMYLAVAAHAFAIDYPNPMQAVGVTTLPGFFTLILKGMVMLLLPLVVVFIIYAGYLFVTAQGNEHEIGKARSALMWAVVGAAVIVGAEIMAQILQDTLSELNT